MSDKYVTRIHREPPLPKVLVSKEEFIQRLIATGMDEIKADNLATNAEALGSYIEINQEMVGIIDD